MTKLQSSTSYVLDEDNEITVCSQCGDPTPCIGTMLCNTCWSINTSFNFFKVMHKQKAKDWLISELEKFGG